MAFDVVHSSIYVPKPAYRKLREIALARECKVHDLILDGIDAVLREHGSDDGRAEAPQCCSTVAP